LELFDCKSQFLVVFFIYMSFNLHLNICRKSFCTAFILGLLTSVMFGLAFYAGQQQGNTQAVERTTQFENEQVLLHGKIQLIEMKVDVIYGQKDAAELQSDFDRVMTVLEQSHAVTGEGIIARDQAMQAAAAEINGAIAQGGQALVDAIEGMIESIEAYLYPEVEEEEE
jgi:hypothetical protein